MNTENNDLRFDRLVDGELNEEERRELLGGLDSEPSGWRRCALAFLEAQCWKQTLLGVARDSCSALPRTTPPDTRRSPWPGRLGTVLAMAVSFMAAVWLGSMILSGRVGNTVPSTGLGSGNEVARGTVPQTPPQPIQPIQPENSLAATPPKVDTPSNPWQLVSVSLPSNGKTSGQSINVPALERDKIDEKWLRGLPPAIPNNVLQALARTGHEIKQHRELVPVPLKDGRQLVMPVDQVEVHYVGNRSY
jgi:hypothetical protein